MENIFIGTSENIGRIAISAPIIYLLVIIYIRIVGKRATSQMNSFDWIVTVAMGSLLASTIIVKDIKLIEGAFAIALLLFMQYALTKAMLYLPWLRKVVRSTPQLLVYNGEFVHENMIKERVVENEVLSAIRHRGIQNIDEVHAVVLETDATFSVISRKENTNAYTLSNVQGLPDGLKEDLKRKN
ncbi:DUF421 domain-containing protein [Aquimarina sp. M1]